MLCCLRCDTLRITREERTLADVVQAQEKHDHTLHADTATSMGHGTGLEGVNVSLNGAKVDTALLGALQQELGIVDTLGAGHDLLAADEDIV